MPIKRKILNCYEFRETNKLLILRHVRDVIAETGVNIDYSRNFGTGLIMLIYAHV